MLGKENLKGVNDAGNYSKRIATIWTIVMSVKKKLQKKKQELEWKSIEKTTCNDSENPWNPCKHGVSGHHARFSLYVDNISTCL